MPVAYADWPRAKAPSPAVALWLAEQSPARDCCWSIRWDKTAGSLLDVLSWQSLCEIAAEARQSGVRLALAGSLDEAAIAIVRELRPDFIGVRGRWRWRAQWRRLIWLVSSPSRESFVVNPEKAASRTLTRQCASPILPCRWRMKEAFGQVGRNSGPSTNSPASVRSVTCCFPRRLS